MAKTTLDVPTLWADHHVLKVREALLKLDGIDDVYASSAWKQVLVTYNNKKTKKADIEKALAEAGYPVGEGEMGVVVQPSEIRRDPQWAEGARTTTTQQADLEMFNRY
jgi:copper chaperone CopZ